MLCVWLGTDRIVIRINGRRIYVKRKEVFGAVVPTQYRSQCRRVIGMVPEKSGSQRNTAPA